MFGKMSITPARSESASELITRMIAKNTLPKSSVREAVFKDLITHVESAYVVSCSKSVKETFT